MVLVGLTLRYGTLVLALYSPARFELNPLLYGTRLR